MISRNPSCSANKTELKDLLSQVNQLLDTIHDSGTRIRLLKKKEELEATLNIKA
jgi:hypothetical protein